MTWDHVDVIAELVHVVRRQLDRRASRVHADKSRLRRAIGSYLIPNVAVITLPLGRALRGANARLGTSDAPLPLVAEVWPPSTASSGTYDLTVKIEEYRRRGDAEFGRLNPDERTPAAWHRQTDDSYPETTRTGRAARPVALP